ncbi:hypothetical protein M8C11_18840 [Micromonospora sp. CPM1]|uniref:ApeA N-terminal domain 1-containing protein n=1 Tax=Micromonospora sp. CPM1 TaxID=2944809 RepID=UPI00207CA0D7|nr:hypothetical protein [Micromonospora sp. CPM1]MCO1616774.1 hypothetical protein [Micromonospora sp. CPM1]
MRELTARGNFWLPETPDRKVGGVLEFHPGEGGKLSLIGELSEPWSSRAESRTSGRIVGQSGSKYLTLDNCFQTYHQMGSGLGLEEFRVGKIFHGALYAKDEETVFDRLSVDLRYLFEWIGWSGLQEEHGQDESTSLPKSTISVTKLEPLKAQLADGVEVTIAHGIGYTGKKKARSLTQGARVAFDFGSPRSLEEVGAYATAVQDLVSIATDEVAEFDEFQLSHPDFEDSLPSGTTYRQYVDFYVEWRARSFSTKDLNPHRMPFSFDAIGGLAGVVEWLNQTADLRPLLNRVMGTRYPKRMYADDRFFNRCAALEGLHRLVKGTKNTKFGRRLDELSAWAGPPFERLVGDVSAWRDLVRDERDDHAHHLSSALGATGASRYYLADSAYWLFVFCLLRRCNYPEEVFASIEKCASVEWLRERLAELMSS